jgi:hypothetical protein
MLGVTTYLTTDIAAIPLLWVLPLALYLLSFILVFSRLPAVVHQVLVALLPLLVLLTVFLMLSDLALPTYWLILLHLALLFVVAMVCHGELARDRPPTRYLTEYFIWMSAGGVLGGLFNALIAPVIFSSLVEYPLMMVLACLLLPSLEGDKRAGQSAAWSLGLLGFCLLLAVALLGMGLRREDVTLGAIDRLSWLGLAAVGLAGLTLAACYVLPAKEDRPARWLDLGLPAALGLVVLGLNLAVPALGAHRRLHGLLGGWQESLPGWLPERLSNLLGFEAPVLLSVLTVGLPAIFCYTFVKRSVRFGLGVGAVLLGGAVYGLLNEDIQLRERSFFGALHIADSRDYRNLMHGTTLHGRQRRGWGPIRMAVGAASLWAAADPFQARLFQLAVEDTWQNPGREPLAYFHRAGPIGQVFAAYAPQLRDQPVAVIGLGAGTLAAYGQPGQVLDFYEIDPLIKRIASDPRYFTYLQDARARGVQLDIILGDARLKLEQRDNRKDAQGYGLLVIDAFSSDAIPIHLITRQALEIYLANLAKHGILAFHISNRHLDLEPVLANLAKDLGLTGYVCKDVDMSLPGKLPSRWVVLAHHPADLARLTQTEQWDLGRTAMFALLGYPGGDGLLSAQAGVCLALPAPWQSLQPRAEVGVWTDDFSNLLRVFDWKD